MLYLMQRTSQGIKRQVEIEIERTPLKGKSGCDKQAKIPRVTNGMKRKTSIELCFVITNEELEIDNKSARARSTPLGLAKITPNWASGGKPPFRTCSFLQEPLKHIGQFHFLFNHKVTHLFNTYKLHFSTLSTSREWTNKVVAQQRLVLIDLWT